MIIGLFMCLFIGVFCLFGCPNGCVCVFVRCTCKCKYSSLNKTYNQFHLSVVCIHLCIYQLLAQQCVLMINMAAGGVGDL